MTDRIGANAESGQRCADDASGCLCLRPANDSDRAFLYGVFESTRAEEFAKTGWGPERVAALLAEQFSMQDTYYRRHYPHGRFDVIMLGETAVGRLYHDWHGSEARLIDIALLPVHRGAGLGTRLLRAFVAQAVSRGLSIVLYVEVDNRVQALYRRLGFETIGESGVYLQMRRPAVPLVDECVTPVNGLALDVVV
ncbi:GNAT family N-acetyltransferase [Trinickia acidisoli]|uniref:GNAT family N-acetyltransferase n=1 Tax=Trinickia acidisoli TaxID=2767482 RepID=UPI001A8D79B1|nr:GNAT family N-acetyltransferase [Trinickia acidisoli]